MASLTTILNWFKTGLKPTQQQFAETFRSFRHKDDKVPVADIEGVSDLLLNKADKEALTNHINDEQKHGGGIQHFANFEERNTWPLAKRGKMLAIVYGANETDAQRGSWVYGGADFSDTEWVKEDNWKLFGGGEDTGTPNSIGNFITPGSVNTPYIITNDVKGSIIQNAFSSVRGQTFEDRFYCTVTSTTTLTILADTYYDTAGNKVNGGFTLQGGGSVFVSYAYGKLNIISTSNFFSLLNDLRKSIFRINKNTTLTSIHEGKHIYVTSDGTELTTNISDFMCTVETATGVNCKINGEALGMNQMVSFRRFGGVDKPLKPVDTDG